MAIQEKSLLKIKVDYEVGKLSKVNICKKHSISRPTLVKLAKEHRWSYQKNLREVNEIIEEKTISKLIEVETDRNVKITDQFLTDIDRYRQLTMFPVGEVARAIKDAGPKGKVTKEEYDRIFAGSKVNKINLEALNIAYSGARKALGMDRDEDIRKAKAIKLNENTQEVLDPLENMTEEEIDKEIDKLS